MSTTIFNELGGLQPRTKLRSGLVDNNVSHGLDQFLDEGLMNSSRCGKSCFKIQKQGCPLKNRWPKTLIVASDAQRESGTGDGETTSFSISNNAFVSRVTEVEIFGLTEDINIAMNQ